MKLHVLTPFYRKDNFDKLHRNFMQADSWTCIVTRQEHLLHEYGAFFLNKNAQHVEYVCKDFYTGDAAYCKINNYIDENKKNIIDDDYYMFLMDDDMLVNGFVEEVKKIESPVIFVSTNRGQKIPYRKERRHETGKLIAAPENVKPGRVWFCQIIVRGSVLKKMKFVENYEGADGMMAIWLKKNFDITYMPNLYTKFNYLEKGRWMVRFL